MRFNGFSQVEDFATEDYFIQWIKNPLREHQEFWEEYIVKFPEKKKVIIEAAKQVRDLKFKLYFPTAYEEQEVWQAITTMTKSKQANNKKKYLARWATSIVAAAGLIITLLWLNFNTYHHKYQTGYGETKQLTLPDSSTVFLNANSTLCYNNDLRASFRGRKGLREVKVIGEAFFSVKKIEGSNFIVNTRNIAIEVLGTEFSVNSRRETTRVVLNSGSIKILYEKDLELNEKILEPGDFLEYSEATNKIVTKTVNSELYSSWKENYLQFDETPLREIAEQIQDNYGLKISFSTPEIAENKFTGVIPMDDIDVLWQVLAKSFKLKIEFNKSEVLISKSASE